MDTLISLFVGFIYGIFTSIYYLEYVKYPETILDFIIYFCFHVIITPIHLIYRGIEWCLIKLGSDL